MSLVFFFTILS